MDATQNLRASTAALSSDRGQDETATLIENLKAQVSELQARVSQLSTRTTAEIPAAHTCAVVNPPACSGTLTAIRDSYNCVTRYQCALTTNPAARTNEQSANARLCWSNYDQKWWPEGTRRPMPFAPPGWQQQTGTAFTPAYVCKPGEWIHDGVWR